MGWHNQKRANRFGVKEQMCWTCEKAGGLCPWSHEFKPVPGWDAESDVMKPVCGDKRCPVKTFRIYDCPEYERG